MEKMTLQEFLDEWHNDQERVLVHTSGSTGTPKPLWVEKRRMEASARITCDFLQLQPGDTALLCMPLDFIAGKMMVVRALVRGLRLLTVPPSGHPLQSFTGTGTAIDFAAMVPMQVWNSLQTDGERDELRKIRHLIIGGGAIDDALAASLRDFPNAVWSTYGMTETLSHIALRRLNGTEATAWYTPFDGVGLSLNDDHCLVVSAPNVCAETLVTNDIAEIGVDGKFRILGRRDNTICSGGLKIQAEEVERLLRPHIPTPFLISQRPDPKFGQVVVLLCESPTMTAAQLKAVCTKVLPHYWVPRAQATVDAIPLTATGKPARREAERLAAAATDW